jgi:Ca2+-binding EF-hand superfamily protein
MFGPDPEMETRVLKNLVHLRHSLGRSGTSAILGIRNSFAHLTSTVVTKEEFIDWLAQNELYLGEHDIDQMVNFFDVDGHGHMNIESFVIGLRGELSQRRTDVVTRAFRSINGTDECEIEEMMAVFNVDMMPEVRKGSMTVDEARVDFVRRLEGTKDALHTHLTLNDFIAYYSWLSASIIDCDQFVGMIETAWRINEKDHRQEMYEICRKTMMETAMKKVKGVADDVKAQHALLQTLSHFDLENKNGLFVNQFIQAAQRLCCPMDEEFASLFFDKFGTDGVLDFNRMVKEMYA